ncbi:MAG: hypothetical protein AMS19_14885, partial [Gemmatimonas sp. SG8_23]
STDEELAVRFHPSTPMIRRLAIQHGLAKDKRTFPGTRRMPRWSREDEARLRELYPVRPNLEIAQELQRSVKSVISKAHALGLRKSQDRLQEMGRENVARRRR